MSDTDEPCKCGKWTLKSWWEAVTDAGVEDTDCTRHARDACLTRTERHRADPALALESLPWRDVRDEWSEAIEAAFPTRSGSHAEYAMAMKMVGHRHSKGELVALVNWLLVERARNRTT